MARFLPLALLLTRRSCAQKRLALLPADTLQYFVNAYEVRAALCCFPSPSP